ncbi:hypothetical protein [Actinoallomurus iriomotensis]|uniref:Uncharacterized protein n=1 Tax=Actinoallomurus iriomotensis TaxID=478107 RepID=A0A9W6RGE6_9ACTN|nr:hypothetical protein [Actinoallomurus iriomotensis]GLY73450.1 hypothetical protein Airi01_017170 [Actinoallomurus iriomotensis]
MPDVRFKNYGLPDEVAYPRQAESIVMRGIDAVGGHRRAEASVQRIRNMAGRPDAVLHTYDVWSDAANNLVGGSASVLTKTLSNLGGWWQGPAYDAFSGYLTGDNGPVQASKSNADHMVAVCKQLLQAYGEIIDVYNQSVQKMADVAVTMSKYAPWKIQNMLRTTEAASNLLSDFASTIAKWEIDHRNALRAYITNSKQTMTEIQAIIEPNDFPSSALIAKKWHYRKD